MIDAIGPETYTFNQLVSMLKSVVGSRTLLINVPPGVAHLLSIIIGRFIGDVVLTREEVEGLIGNLLITDSPPAGETKLSDWVQENRQTLGKRYANELSRHYRKWLGS